MSLLILIPKHGQLGSQLENCVCDDYLDILASILGKQFAQQQTNKLKVRQVVN